jgi:hypothetical protein
MQNILYVIHDRRADTFITATITTAATVVAAECQQHGAAGLETRHVSSFW